MDDLLTKLPKITMDLSIKILDFLDFRLERIEEFSEKKYYVYVRLKPFQTYLIRAISHHPTQDRLICRDCKRDVPLVLDFRSGDIVFTLGGLYSAEAMKLLTPELVEELYRRVNLNF